MVKENFVNILRYVKYVTNKYPVNLVNHIKIKLNKMNFTTLNKLYKILNSSRNIHIINSDINIYTKNHIYSKFNLFCIRFVKQHKQYNFNNNSVKSLSLVFHLLDSILAFC